METLGEWKHFRCFVKDVDELQLVDFLKEHCEVLIIVLEHAMSDRRHIHATIRPFKAINTFRDALRKKFPQIFGNKSYSIAKVRDYDSNIKYCCKGRCNDYPDVLYTTLTNEEVKQYYNEYWLLAKQIQDSKQSIVSKTEVNMGCQNDPSVNEAVIVKRPRSLTWSEKLTKTILQDYPLLCEAIVQHRDGLLTEMDYPYYQDKLLGIILKSLGRHSKTFDDFMLLRFYNAQYNAIIQARGSSQTQENFEKMMGDKLRTKLL